MKTVGEMNDRDEYPMPPLPPIRLCKGLATLTPMGFDIADFHQLMDLEPHGPDTYVGVGPDYPWGRVYGGQVVAQALVAAAHTVEPQYVVHSLHAYFIRGGDCDEPIRFEVDRIRNGRSFVTRRVVARQSGGAILNLSASFQVEEDEADAPMINLGADTPGPEDVADTQSWGPLVQRRDLPADPALGRASAWLRLVDDLGGDAVLHAAGLAYLSDDFPTEAVRETHPLWHERRGEDDLFHGASLDHAIWFHRCRPVTDWQFHDFRGSGMVGGRGVAIGNVFASDGTHVATVVQEALLRARQPDRLR